MTVTSESLEAMRRAAEEYARNLRRSEKLRTELAARLGQLSPADRRVCLDQLDAALPADTPTFAGLREAALQVLEGIESHVANCGGEYAEGAARRDAARLRAALRLPADAPPAEEE